MPTVTTFRTPKFRLHKPTRQGFVELDGHRDYLGRFDNLKTKQLGHQRITEWLTNNRRMPVSPEEVTITELLRGLFKDFNDKYCSDRIRGHGKANCLKKAGHRSRRGIDRKTRGQRHVGSSERRGGER